MTVRQALVNIGGYAAMLPAGDALAGTLASRQRQSLTGAAGQTQFTVPGGYSLIGAYPLLDVYINGVYVTEYTATNGSTFTLADGLDSANDEVIVVPLVMNAISTSIAPGTGTSDPGSSGSSGTDPNFSNVVLLTHLDDVSNSPVDQKGHALSKGLSIVTSGQKFGSGAGRAATASSWMTSTSNDYILSSGSFTIEFWMNPNEYPPSNQGEFSIFGSLPQAARSQPSSDFFVVLTTSGAIRVYTKETTATGASNVVARSSWTHVALVRDQSALYIFVNGVSSGKFSITPQAYTDPAIFLGSYFDQASWSPIMFDDLRITKGVARYTANFTPPAAAFPDQ